MLYCFLESESRELKEFHKNCKEGNPNAVKNTLNVKPSLLIRKGGEYGKIFYFCIICLTNQFSDICFYIQSVPIDSKVPGGVDGCLKQKYFFSPIYRVSRNEKQLIDG